MIKKETAIEIQKHALNAIRSLTTALLWAQKECSAEDLAIIKRGVGLSLGTIQMDLLEVINAQYPELDDGLPQITEEVAMTNWMPHTFGINNDGRVRNGLGQID